MKRALLNIVLILAFTLAPAGLLGGRALAACPGGNTAKGQVLQGVNETGSACSDAGVESTFGVIVNIMSVVLGAVAVIMVIVAGFKYVTSGGDAGKVSSAKSTLIYALVGIAVAVLAQLLIHIVVGQASEAAAKP